MPNDIESKIVVKMKNKELQSKLVNYAKSLTNCLYAAEDLVQHAREKIREKRETMERKNIGGFLTTIIKHEHINQYRKKQRNPQQNREQDWKRDSIYENTNQIESNLAVQTIESALENLKKKNKDVLELHIQGNKYEQIAKILNIPVGTVKARIFIARKELAENLSKQDSSYKVRRKETKNKLAENNTTIELVSNQTHQQIDQTPTS